MKLILNPFLDEQTQELLSYISEKTESEQRYFCEYRLSTLKTFPDNGTYNVENVSIKITNLGEILVQNGTVMKQVYITMDGTDDDINELLKNIEKRTTELPFVKNKVNILINNLYTQVWKIDEQIPIRTLDSIKLENIENIINDFRIFFSDERKCYYKKLEIPYSRVYMLYGPPGTGKTSLIHTVASFFGKHVANLDFNKEMDDRAFRETVRNVPTNSILCIEDIDCLFEERKANDSFSSTVTFSGLLNTLDGLTKHDGLAIVITTNNIRTLDEALKRRVDYYLEFNYSSRKQVKGMFDRFIHDEDKWEEFWNSAKYCKLTPNILQKYFIKYQNLEESIQSFSTHFFARNENMYN